MNAMKKISISSLEMEIPALETDAEGKLRGGFCAVGAEDTTGETNGNCKGCGGVPLKDSKCYDNANCNNCLCTEEPTTTTESACAIPTFDMNNSLLF